MSALDARSVSASGRARGIRRGSPASVIVASVDRRRDRRHRLAHPFTAPVRPPTMRRSKMLKKMSAGIIDSDVKASTLAVSTEYCDAKACTPSGSVKSLVVEEEQRQQVAVPAADEGEDADRDDAGNRQREHHAPEEAEAAASVDERGLLDLVGESHAGTAPG
jgi:hypothetical protein